MKSSKFNLIGAFQDWMDSIAGQTFLNYAYSWGASVVILGALFKLTHLPYANLMLYIGMGTEVFVFFISAFDRPFDAKVKAAEVPAELENMVEDEVSAEAQQQDAPQIIGGGTMIIGGLPAGAVPGGTTGVAEGVVAEGNVAAAGGINVVAAGGGFVPAAPVNSGEDLEDATVQYVEKLKLLTETLDRVEKQIAGLTTESEEMKNLNRTLTGINTVYELQLKGVSQQVGSIEQINEQTRRMAEQIEELNGVYARMIKALTVNMKNAAGQVDA